MEHFSLTTLFIALFFLILGSAFFSSSETSLMALNRYKLKNSTKTSRIARIVAYLLDKPDSLLSVILICNNFTNITASAIATIIGVRLMGDMGIIIATCSLTLIILIFAEITPKTLAVLMPERIANIAAVPIRILLWLLHPMVLITNTMSNNILKIFDISSNTNNKQNALNPEELRIAINEANIAGSSKYQAMLLNILDLEHHTVNDVMTPRQLITGINIQEDIAQIHDQLKTEQHTLLPIMDGNAEHITGIVHTRDLVRLLVTDKFNLTELGNITKEPYFIPEGTSLYMQLINFQQQKQRIALVVDEYGVVIGLITVEDILKEIVGEFAANSISQNNALVPQVDGSYIIHGSKNIRDLNRDMSWSLPTNGAKTISGLIIEHLETIPNNGVCLLINNYPVEVMLVKNNKIASVKIGPQIKSQLDS